ncbi:MAG: sodium:proton antiporter, partial [Clostridia bacterium]|nr:sodium:proton antiporter [Clostridia bacterium]
MIAALLFIIPLVGILLSCIAALRSERMRDCIYRCELALVFILALAAFICCLRGNVQALSLNGICGMGLNLCLDGFRSLYVLVASFMWLMTGLMSGEYFAHYQNRTRYYIFNQITLFATLGVFMSDDLMTTFIFFETMSLASYPWVVHDENEAAMKAGKTYLAIAVFGGMVTLMGLFMAYRCIGSLSFDAFSASRGNPDMTLPAALILVGFAAKAGLFPL